MHAHLCPASTILSCVLPQEGMLPGAWLSLVPGFLQFHSWSRAVGMWAKAAAVGNADAQRRVVHGRRRCAARRIVHMSIALPGAQRPASRSYSNMLRTGY